MWILLFLFLLPCIVYRVIFYQMEMMGESRGEGFIS